MDKVLTEALKVKDKSEIFKGSSKTPGKMTGEGSMDTDGVGIRH